MRTNRNPMIYTVTRPRFGASDELFCGTYAACTNYENNHTAPDEIAIISPIWEGNINGYDYTVRERDPYAAIDPYIVTKTPADDDPFAEYVPVQVFGGTLAECRQHLADLVNAWRASQIG